MTFHHQAVAKAQQRVLQQLGSFLTPRRFYLGGGSALAIQLGHRHSVDLDWFTDEPIRDPTRLVRLIQDEGIKFVTTLEEPGTLHGTVSGVEVSILEFRYPFLQRLVSCKPLACRLASRADLAAMKLSALAQRGARKDFVDVYALAMTNVPLRKMLGWYQKKFSVQDIAHVVYALTYFKDAESQRMPRMLWETDWRTIKTTIQAWVGKMVR